MNNRVNDDSRCPVGERASEVEVKRRVVVDRGLCVGSGMCTALAPDFFDLDEGGVLVVKEEVAQTPEALALLEDAVACCPAEALSIQGL